VPRDAKSTSQQAVAGLAQLIARLALREVLHAESEQLASRETARPAVTPDGHGENKRAKGR